MYIPPSLPLLSPPSPSVPVSQFDIFLQLKYHTPFLYHSHCKNRCTSILRLKFVYWMTRTYAGDSEQAIIRFFLFFVLFVLFCFVFLFFLLNYLSNWFRLIFLANFLSWMPVVSDCYVH
jgi:hypothetical protein